MVDSRIATEAMVVAGDDSTVDSQIATMAIVVAGPDANVFVRVATLAMVVAVGDPPRTGTTHGHRTPMGFRRRGL